MYYNIITTTNNRMENYNTMYSIVHNMTAYCFHCLHYSSIPINFN